MAYISSNENRFYVASESNYAQVGPSSAFNRIPAVKLTARQQRNKSDRKDKTGSRTFAGYPLGGRRSTTFDLRTYMTNWADQTKGPAYGPLLEACFGHSVAITTAATISGAPGAGRITFLSAHGLQPGQGVTYGSDLRFVSAVVDAQTIQLNAPFSVTPANGTAIGATATYTLGTELKSATILDCWSPSSAVQRLIYGAAVDQVQIQVNSDFHEFQFSGPACDIIDSSTFQQDQGGLGSFPEEPSSGSFNYSLVPGHLGQIWLGSTPDQFFTMTSATVTLNNNVTLRDREFGSALARGISASTRSVTVDFSIYQQDDSQTKALYQAARQESPVNVTLQLGQQSGQLMGINLKNVVLVTPEFDDSDLRQQWVFKTSRAQGIADDEISIAFG